MYLDKMEVNFMKKNNKISAFKTVKIILFFAPYFHQSQGLLKIKKLHGMYHSRFASIRSISAQRR